MPEVYDSNGNLVPNVVTQEEAQQQAQSAADKAREEAEAKAKEEIASKQGEIEKLQEQERNFKALRDKTDASEKDRKTAEEQLTQVQEQITDIQKELANTKTSQATERRDAGIARLAGDNKEVADKMRVLFDTQLAAMDVSTPEAINAKLAAAYTLATQSAPPEGVLNGAAVSGAAGGEATVGAESVSEDLKSLARPFGVPEADLKKYHNPNITYSNAKE